MRRLLAAAFVLFFAHPAAAEVEGKSVSEDAGPVSDLSTNVGDGSAPVHERGRTMRETSAGSVGSQTGDSTRESSVAPVKSGTISDIAAGSVSSSRSLRRERNEARLAPAPPRMAPDGGGEPQIFWEPAYDLDGLVEDVGAIEPMERVDATADEAQPVAEESANIEESPPSE
jgi:hypothetical protein